METKPTINTGTDKKAVQDVAETLFKEVDNRAWEKVINTMADSVYTDYTALGGDAGFKSPQTIVEGWQSLLPGFERTVHNPHNFAVWIAGDRATATLDAIATHYLDNDYWTVFVGYDTEYVKGNDGWKLARIDISLYSQAGNQSLPQAAAENVKNGTIPALKSAQNTAALEQFFTGLEERNLDKVLSSLSKNVIQDMPFAPANFPKSLNGIDAMQAQYTGVMDYTQAYEREYFGTANPNVILAKFKGTI
ncbi:MAG: nuclear transport factor 2 family protein, partial [Cytophagales bacterium]|nr:nuclear transport factor 2 family protein [Cytophagales bacterium]